MLIFIFKTIICLAAFYATYRLLAVGSTFYRANRIVLLSSTVLTLVLSSSIFSLSWLAEVARPVLNLPVMLIEHPMAANVPLAIVPEGGSLLTWQNALALVYVIGVVVCAVCMLRSMFSVVTLIHHTPVFRATDECTLLLTDHDVPSFSWYRYIVMSRDDYKVNGDSIFAHELAHVRLHHSLWLGLMNAVCALLWLNPVVWLVRRELLLVAEYEADEAVLSTGIDAKQYKLLLIEKAAGTSRYTIANSLNHSSLKKRITMMRANKSKPWTVLRYGYVAVVAAAVLPAFASREVLTPIEEMLRDNLIEEIRRSVQPDTDYKVGQNSSILQTDVPDFIKDGMVCLIDGRRAMADELSDLKSSEIADVTVVKNAEALKQYSVEGAKEMLIITTVDANKPDGGDVLDMPEQLPKYKDGDIAGLMKFFADNIKYPEPAIKEGKEGRVKVQFVVYKDGRIGNTRVEESVSKELDEEAIRIVNLTSGKWIPGYQDGKAVNSHFCLPISFRLQ